MKPKDPIKLKMTSSDSSKKTKALVSDKELELVLNEALNHKCAIMMSIVTDEIGDDGNNILKNWWKLYSFPTADIPIALESLRSDITKKVLMYDGPRQLEDIKEEAQTHKEQIIVPESPEIILPKGD